MSERRTIDREFFAIGGIISVVMAGVVGLVVFMAHHESRCEAERWAQLYTLTAEGRTWRNVHYVQQWRRTLTVETQDGQRITVCEPYVIETQATLEVHP